MGTALKSGTYEPRNEVKVLVWPSPDADGTGDNVTDDAGDYWTTPDGREIKHYVPPKGFINQPHKNEHNQITSDNWVLADERGNVARDTSGNAVTIAEGQAVVISPDGGFQVLPDAASQRQFADSHNLVDDTVPDSQPVPNRSSGAQPAHLPSDTVAADPTADTSTDGT